MFADWPCPAPGGDVAEENARLFDRQRPVRLLVVAPLFDEHNKMRHQLVEVMRRLDLSGIDSFLPDLPGTNESVRPLQSQSLTDWRSAIRAAASHFAATHVLAVRGGGLLMTPDDAAQGDPVSVPGWLYGPVAGRSILRSMLRARILSSRERGLDEAQDTLADAARTHGIELAGHPIGAEMFRQLERAEKPDLPNLVTIEQASLNGSPLWLRAEPDDDPEQADALAGIIAIAIEDGSAAR